MTSVSINRSLHSIVSVNNKREAQDNELVMSGVDNRRVSANSSRGRRRCPHVVLNLQAFT